MATISNTPRPGYVWDSTDNVWYPIGVGAHQHTNAADTPAVMPYSTYAAAGKNKILNGDFGVWQRGTSTTVAGPQAGFGADRWGSYITSGSTVALTQQTFTPGTAPVSGYESNFFLRYNRTTTGSSESYLYQRIENVRTLAGQTATLSFWAKAGSSITFPIGDIYFEQDFGSGGSSAVITFASASTQTITTSWARYTFTITLPSISGKTIGANSNLGVVFRMPVSFGAVSFDIWGVQVEAGSTATAFQTATGNPASELAACQRYYVRWSGANSYSHFGTGVTQSSTNAYFTVVQPVDMRVAPHTLDYSTMGFFNYVPNVFALSNLALNSATTKVSQLYGTTSGATAQQFVTLCTNNSSSGFIGLSAEL